MNGCAHKVGWLYMTLNHFTYLRGLLRLGAKMLVVSGGLWRFVFFPFSLLCPRLGGCGLVVFCPRAFRPTFLSLVGGLSGLAKRLGFAVFRMKHALRRNDSVWSHLVLTRNFQCFGFSTGGCENRFSHVSFLFMFPSWHIGKFWSLSASQWSNPKNSVITYLPPVWSSPMCPMVGPAAISQVWASTQGFEMLSEANRISTYNPLNWVDMFVE